MNKSVSALQKELTEQIAFCIPKLKHPVPHFASFLESLLVILTVQDIRPYERNYASITNTVDRLAEYLQPCPDSCGLPWELVAYFMDIERELYPLRIRDLKDDIAKWKEENPSLAIRDPMPEARLTLLCAQFMQVVVDRSLTLYELEHRGGSRCVNVSCSSLQCMIIDGDNPTFYTAAQLQRCSIPMVSLASSMVTLCLGPMHDHDLGRFLHALEISFWWQRQRNLAYSKELLFDLVCSLQQIVSSLEPYWVNRGAMDATTAQAFENVDLSLSEQRSEIRLLGSAYRYLKPFPSRRRRIFNRNTHGNANKISTAKACVQFFISVVAANLLLTNDSKLIRTLKNVSVDELSLHSTLIDV